MSVCVYCGAPADTIDHVIPRAWGGADTPENKVSACRSCNSRKSTKPAELFQLPKREQRAWLIARGWKRVARNCFLVPEDGYRSHYSLAAAIRHEAFRR